MSDLTEALDRLIEEHRRIGSPVPDFLRPGIDPETARGRIEALGLRPPDELVELFAWHDGTDEDAYRAAGAGPGYPRFFGNTFFGSLEAAIDLYQECLQTDRNTAAAYPDDDVPRTWSPDWFPPFSGGSDTFALDCGPNPTTRGRLYDVRWHPGPADEPTSAVRFRSLTRMIQLLVRRFETDGYHWNPMRRFLEDRTDVLRLRFEEEIADARIG